MDSFIDAKTKFLKINGHWRHYRNSKSGVLGIVEIINNEWKYYPLSREHFELSIIDEIGNFIERLNNEKLEDI